MTVIIKEGDIKTAVHLSNKIPEFINPAGQEEYQRRLRNTPHLILIAYQNDQAIAFKVGYKKEDYFYSWMGGVLPAFRKLGIAKMLADHQENWVKNKGYQKLIFKTRNQHKGMLIFALKNGFNIIGFTPKDEVAANRILLRKVFK